MSQLPKPIIKLIDKFERLPGIGPKSAQRLVFYLLHNPIEELEDFAQKLISLKKEIVLCSLCHNVSETDPCQICDDQNREIHSMMVVEAPLDVIAIENADKYIGKYHVLHGAIDPLNNIGPDQLYLVDLLERLDDVSEIILATNPTMEGEATALYINQLIHTDGRFTARLAKTELKITRIGHGLPIGADIEYIDGITIARALEGRRVI